VVDQNPAAGQPRRRRVWIVGLAVVAIAAACGVDTRESVQPQSEVPPAVEGSGAPPSITTDVAITAGESSELVAETVPLAGASFSFVGEPSAEGTRWDVTLMEFVELTDAESKPGCYVLVGSMTAVDTRSAIFSDEFVPGFEPILGGAVVNNDEFGALACSRAEVSDAGYKPFDGLWVTEGTTYAFYQVFRLTQAPDLLVFDDAFDLGFEVEVAATIPRAPETYAPTFDRPLMMIEGASFDVATNWGTWGFELDEVVELAASGTLAARGRCVALLGTVKVTDTSAPVEPALLVVRDDGAVRPVSAPCELGNMAESREPFFGIATRVAIGAEAAFYNAWYLPNGINVVAVAIPDDGAPGGFVLLGSPALGG